MKKVFLFCLIMVTAVSFSSCGKKGEVSLSKEEVSSIEEEHITEPLIDKVTIAVDDALKAYTDYLKKIFEGNEEKAKDVRYTIAYINDDDIPELIYMDGGAKANGAHVLICDNDLLVYDIGEFGEYGSFAYKEKQGLILSYYTNQGMVFADFYKLLGLSLVDDTYFEMDQPALESDKTRYYIDGDETDEVSYYEKYSSKETKTFTYVYYDDVLSYKDTDDVLRVLSEFAATGKKPSIINIESNYPNLVGEWVLARASIGNSTVLEDAGVLGVYSYLKISETGDIRFKMTYEDKVVEDSEMNVTYIQKDEKDENFACIGFKNNEGTREFLVFTSPDNTVTANMTDLSGEFSQYSFYFVYIKAEEDL